MSYAKALATLEQYAPRKLRAYSFRDVRGNCCALGALGAVLYLGIYSPGVEAHALTYDERRALMNENDNAPFGEGPSPGRYRYVLEWLRERVAEEQSRG